MVASTLRCNCIDSLVRCVPVYRRQKVGGRMDADVAFFQLLRYNVGWRKVRINQPDRELALYQV